MESAEERESALLLGARYGLVITAGALPLYVVRWRYGPLPTTLLETLILLTVGVYVVGRWRDGWRRPTSTPYDIPIGALLLAGAVAVIVAPDHRTALGLYRAYFMEPIALFYVAADLLRLSQWVKRTLIALAAGSSLFAILNIAAFVRTVAAHQLQVGAAPSAVYGDANYVAMYLEPPVAVALGLLLFGVTDRWRAFGGAWAGVAGLALLLTLSKGSYVALVVTAVIVVVTVASWRLRAALAAVFLAGAVIFTRVPAVAERLAGTGLSITQRIQIYNAAFDTLRQHPVFGTGLGTYSFKLNRVSPEVYPHDIWLTFWVELGILGMVAFGVILFGLLWRGWRAWGKVAGFNRAALWGVLVALVAWVIHGLVDTPYWKNDMSVEFWILAAIEVAVLGSLGVGVNETRTKIRTG